MLATVSENKCYVCFVLCLGKVCVFFLFFLFFCCMVFVFFGGGGGWRGKQLKPEEEKKIYPPSLDLSDLLL